MLFRSYQGVISPKQFGEWCFEQGDRISQPNEQEHGFELRNNFFWRWKKRLGAGMSEGDACGPHKLAPRHEGVGGGGGACGPLVRPPDQLSGPEIFKNSRKNHTKFSGPSRNFNGCQLIQLKSTIKRKRHNTNTGSKVT